MKSHWSLRRYYLYYNRKWFGGYLPLDTVVNWEPPNCNAWGLTTRLPEDRFHIQLDPALRGVIEFALIVLLHEMAHINVWTRLRVQGHGEKFQQEMKRLAAAGAFNDLW